MNSLGILRFFTAGACALTLLTAQDTVRKSAFEQQLVNQYTTTTLAPDRIHVVQPGTVLLVQKAGIGAGPVAALTFNNSYKDGKIRHAVSSTILVDKNSVRDLQIGEAVYVLKTEAKEPNITIQVQSCGACDPANPDPAAVRASVSFQFPKGYLATADWNQIQQTIGQVFSVATANAPQQAAQGAPAAGGYYANTKNPSDHIQLNPDGTFVLQEKGATYHGVYTIEGSKLTLNIAETGRPARASLNGSQIVDPAGQTWVQQSNVADPGPSQLQPPPAKIELGQTQDQVVSQLGQPDKLIDLGPKRIYIYKDLKITFVNGKVSDVQ